MLGSVCALGFAAALTLALSCSPAAAKIKLKYKSGHKETEHASKEPFGNIPKGPLQIFISINQQKLHLYSDGTHVADALVATGVPGHLTPMGVFSVIAKDRFHHSNIYSNAPMPYMQRITWSGVAMHQGPGVGRQASHGCIRMPQDFAARLWVLTRLGARVIIARNELKPSDFADPHLFVHKDKVPEHAAAVPAAAEAIRTAQTVDTGKASDASSLLSDGVKIDPAKAEPAAAAVAMPEPPKPAVVDAAAKSDTAGADTPKLDALKPDASKSEVPAVAETTITVPAAQPAEPAALPAAPAAPEGLRTTQSAAPEAPAIPPAATAPQQAVPMPAAKPAAIAETPAAAKSQIAIFVSRKEKKIYVRQHFAPLFDAPITIADPEQPLGTHVFTAMDYLGDNSTFRWNVVSLPGDPPKAARNADSARRSERYAKGRRHEEPAARPAGELPPPQTPEQALGRIEIPQDVIDRISEMMVPGSSLIVSDQGLGEETGEGTDFIVITR